MRRFRGRDFLGRSRGVFLETKLVVVVALPTQIYTVGIIDEICLINLLYPS